MSHNEDFLEALVGGFRRMMKDEFKGLHDRLDRLENARAGPRYPNSYGQRRDRVPNRETHDAYYEDLRRRDNSRASSSYQASPWKPTFPKKEEKVQLFSHPKPKTEVPNPRMQGMSWCSIQPLENLDEEEDAVQGELVAASSIPPLEDELDEECAVQGELLIAINSTTSLEDTDEKEHAVLELFVASSAQTVQIKEEQFEDLEHYDFIGVEQILSMCCSKKIIVSYMRSYGIRIQLVFLALRMSKNGAKTSKYSKYLFRWKGRCQYLCHKDPMNSRTNYFQERENDENMAGPKAWPTDPIQVPTGPFTRPRSKAVRVALKVIQEVLSKACSKKAVEGMQLARVLHINDTSQGAQIGLSKGPWMVHGQRRSSSCIRGLGCG